MNKPTYKVRVKSSGLEIEVYATKRNTLCNFANSKDEYFEEEITYLTTQRPQFESNVKPFKL